MPKEYIEREALLDKIGTVPMWNEYAPQYPYEIHMALISIAQELRKEINSIPAADVEPVPHGEWIEKEIIEKHPFAKNHYCSNCKTDTNVCGNYCAVCGAKMDGGK